jgi:hypothetical protein
MEVTAAENCDSDKGVTTTDRRIALSAIAITLLGTAAEALSREAQGNA